MLTTKQAGGRAGGAFRGGPGGRSPPPGEDAMCAAIRNPPIRTPAIRSPADHYRLACIRPATGMA
eukprot:10197028-Alexandrium_andersonii.AAC.1